ncbi:hypothetical protein ACIP5Y_31440 [Nocardia sp. NPDC088792]|uniref:hypothetical protein n=1 Tax=Nocardia sp. NPDC088792 TaxID=3364332 RepID=UPI003808491D
MTPWSTNPDESAAIDALSTYLTTLTESLHAIPDARYTTPSGGFTLPPHALDISAPSDLTDETRNAA